jgi:hypothetical protein
MATDISDLMQRIEKAVDFLTIDELKNLRGEMEKKGFLNLDSKEDPDAIKEALQHISIEDLDGIAPSAIKMLISELTAAEDTTSSIIGEEQKPQTIEENEETLVQEAVRILAQRPKPGAEVPRDLQPRMMYILSKLHHKFSVAYREIERRIALSRQTIANYSDKYEDEQPDTVKMWVQSVENKVYSKTEETIAKQASTRAIETLKGNILLGDVIRNTYAGVASVKGYNLHDQKHLEKVIKEGASLFFSIDGIQENIMKIERENEILRNQNVSLKKVNVDLYNKILILTSEET